MGRQTTTSETISFDPCVSSIIMVSLKYHSSIQTEPAASPSQDKDNKDHNTQISRGVIYKMWHWINKLSNLRLQQKERAKELMNTSKL